MRDTNHRWRINPFGFALTDDQRDRLRRAAAERGSQDEKAVTASRGARDTTAPSLPLIDRTANSEHEPPRERKP